MKKLAFIIAIAFASITVNAQNTVVFKLKFLPDHSYKATMKMNMDMQMTGLPVKNAKSKKPATTPKSMQTKMDMSMDMDIKTGAIVPANTFPVTMSYTNVVTNVTLNNKALPAIKNPLTGQTVYGQSDLDGKFQIDSVSTGGTNEQMKAMMKEMVNKLQGQVKFPEHPLNIGESFTQEIPVKIPTVGINMDMTAKMTYKLIDIKANLAYFDTDMSMTFGGDMAKYGGVKMAGTGGGKGKMIYNIGENYFNSMTQNMNMIYNMTMGDKGKMAAKMKMVTDVENVISRN